MYILRCAPSTDLQLSRAIAAQGVECICVPLFKVHIDKRTRRKTFSYVPAYPGYLFTDSPTPFPTYEGYLGYMKRDEKYLEVDRDDIDQCFAHVLDMPKPDPKALDVHAFPGTVIIGTVINKFRNTGYRIHGQR